MKLTSPTQLDQVARDFRASLEGYKTTISLCGGTNCTACGCNEVLEVLKTELEARNLTYTVRLIVTGCQGLCSEAPLISINPDDVLYCNVEPGWIKRIVSDTVIEGKTIPDYCFTDPVNGTTYEKFSEIPFFSDQTRVLLANSPHIDPSDIRDYISVGGYRALAKALFEMEPGEIVDEISASGLRGRGGGGFPTGRKWASGAKAPGDHKWVICNADEGNPGAYMDGSLLESNPHLIIEGMIIGAKAVGAGAPGGGYIYVRNEYPLALSRISEAINEARRWGLLGNDILGSGLSFDIRINRGGGAFVCGESTALMASLEGKPGEPRPKYVHTVEKGYHNEPSVLNNVETWANVPGIILDGAQKYREHGTDASPGTKIFSLVGKVRHTGLVEIPMDRSVRSLVEGIGGGAPEGKKLKAVQTGGPSGGCLPVSQLDLQLDFDVLNEAGSMMGAGGIIVMDEDTCMVDIALHFIRFNTDESCGKCTPCREGLQEMERVLTHITEGKAEMDDLGHLEELGQWMIGGCLCALGATAPHPVLSTIKYFRDEYETHIKGHKCPGGVCRELIEYSVIEANCTGCGDCVTVCPTGAVSGLPDKVHKIDMLLCTKCDECYKACKFEAIGK